MKIVVLGGGLIGKPIAVDLAKDFDTGLIDLDISKLKELEKQNIQLIQADIGNAETLKALLKDVDFVVNAVPGFMGYETLKTIISCGKHVVDIAFSPEDVMQLDELAKEKGVIAISDMGVAPGMSNILASYLDTQLDRTDSIKIYVGGLPLKREWPYEYKAGFSPIDVIEEYTRPARIVQHGKMVTKEALSEVELMDFEEIGTLEAFNSDGLRSLIYTMDVPDMVEKTLRYPGHAELMRVFRESGFFGASAIDIKGNLVRPIDLTSKLLFEKWKLARGEEEFTVMKIEASGVKDGKSCTWSYNLLDRYDAASGVHSMARTTGYAATAAVRLVINGHYKHIGLSVPEYIGRQKNCVEFMLGELAKRKVVYKYNC